MDARRSKMVFQRIVWAGGGAIAVLLVVLAGTYLYNNSSAPYPEQDVDILSTVADLQNSQTAIPAGPPPVAAGPEWPDVPPPADFPLPIAGGESRDFNFESTEAAIRVWLPARARDWTPPSRVSGPMMNVQPRSFGALLDGNRVFSVCWFDLYRQDVVTRDLPKIAQQYRPSESALDTHFMLWGRYPAIAREYRYGSSMCHLTLTFVRDRRVFHLSASIPNLGERPVEAVRFFESFHLIGEDPALVDSGSPESTPPVSEGLPPCRKPIAAVDTSRGRARQCLVSGPKRGLSFESRAPNGGRLVGMIVRESEQDGDKRLQSLQPIYQLNSTYHLGQQHGSTAASATTGIVRHVLLAEPGQVVMAIRLSRDNELNVAGLTLVYGQLAADGKTNSKAVSASRWVGRRSLNPDSIAGALGPIVGLHGFAAENVNTLGVIEWNR